MKCKVCGKEIGYSGDECAFCPIYLPGYCIGRIGNEYCNDCCRKSDTGPGPIYMK